MNSITSNIRSLKAKPLIHQLSGGLALFRSLMFFYSGTQICVLGVPIAPPALLFSCAKNVFDSGTKQTCTTWLAAATVRLILLVPVAITTALVKNSASSLLRVLLSPPSG